MGKNHWVVQPHTNNICFCLEGKGGKGRRGDRGSQRDGAPLDEVGLRPFLLPNMNWGMLVGKSRVQGQMRRRGGSD